MTNIKPSNFIAVPRQANRIEQRRKEKTSQIKCGDFNIQANAGVYDTSGDSELMIETIKISPNESFLEIGCGTGVISIALSKKAKKGIGVDINELAVENSKINAKKYNIENVDFFVSNVFENITDKFDVIACNPPYSNHEAPDNIARMFWDPNDEMKIKFFKEVNNYLKDNGRIYLAWANFADIDVDLPIKLADKNGFKLINTSTKPHSKNEFTFFVFEFKKMD